MSAFSSSGSALGQVGDLLAMRWSMTSPWARAGLIMATLVGLALGPVSVLAGIGSANRLAEFFVDDLLGASMVVVAIGLVVSAIASSGGRELFPRQQLLAYPVSPSTEHLLTLLLSPANLAWWVQGLGLFFMAGAAVALRVPGGAGRVDLVIAATLAGLVCGAWILAATTAAQLAAWLVELVRSVPGGRWLLRLALVAIAVTAVRSANAQTLSAFLGWQPASQLTELALSGATRSYWPAVGLLGALLAVAAGFVLTGGAVYRRVTRRLARDQTSAETKVYPPREPIPAASVAADLRMWRRQDWAAIWRSVPLRRGLLVLAVVPVIGGLFARVGVNDLSLIAGVVAAGAGLVLGVNAFSLDAEGAPWRDSLPVPPRIWLVARGWVLAEMILATSALALLAAAISSVGRLHPAAVVAAVMGLLTMSGQVLARCLRWSVSRPERAELRTTRDAPASPGRLVGYSAQLVAVTMWTAVVMAVAARIGSPVLPVLLCLPSLTLTALSLRRTARHFDDPTVRALLVQAVSRG